MSISNDIRQYAGVGTISEALRAINLCDDQCLEGCGIEETTDWYQAGAETYCLEWSVIHIDGHRDAMIAKACVSMAGGLTEKVAEWIARRVALHGLGVKVPRLAFVHKATIYEEYIPYGFLKTLTGANESMRGSMLADLTQAANAAEALGFRNLPLHDARTHGDDFVIVDFGQDLGGRHPDVLTHGTLASRAMSELDRYSQRSLRARNDRCQ
jgi:hypothetical protein